MATYKEIQKFVKTEYGFQPKSCWIADIKEQAGLPVKRAWNRIGNERKNPCPTEKVDAIKDAFHHYGMINNADKKEKSGKSYY